jgi:hypothetical protein
VAFDNLLLGESGLEKAEERDRSATVSERSMNFVVCHPRSGSEWLKITLCECGYEAKAYREKYISPESILFHHDGWEYLNGGRLIRGNGPPRWLGRKRRWLGKEKVVIITRDPKDIIVSYWHFLKFRRERLWIPRLYDFTKKYINDPINFLNRWYLAGMDHLIVSYESMCEDMPSALALIIKFFNMDTGRLSKFRKMGVEETEPLAFGESPTDDPRSRHCRRGEFGVWKEYYSANERQWIENECLRLHPFYERYRTCTDMAE